MPDHKHKIWWTADQTRILLDCAKQDLKESGKKTQDWWVVKGKFERATGIRRSEGSLRNRWQRFYKQASLTYLSKKQKKPLRKDARQRVDEIKEKQQLLRGEKMNLLDEADDMMLELGLASFDVDELLGAASVEPMDETSDFENMNVEVFNDFFANLLVDGGANA